MKDKSLRISATEFKARCLSVFRKLERREYTRVVVTRHGNPVAELTPPRTSLPRLWGVLRGTVSVAPGVDLTAPVIVGRLDAARGILHR